MNNQESLRYCTPRQTRAFIVDCLDAGLVPFVQSSPGCGKSSIFRSIAKDAGLKLIDHRLSTATPEDFSGLPRFIEDRAEFVPFADTFPVEGMEPPEGYEGWLLFLDELNSISNKDVQAGTYKLLLDKEVGQKRLHERVFIGSAGNLATDRAITYPMGTALQSRVVHIEMRVDFEEWLYDVALPNHYDPRVIAFLSAYPKKLMDFRPDHNDKTFCCPRTWEFMNRFVKNKPTITDQDAILFGGTITSGTAVEFVQFTKVFHNLVNIKDICHNPDNCPVPRDTATKWATVTHVMEHVDADNLTPISTYISRFTLDFRILFYRSLMVQHPEMRRHPAYAKGAVDLSAYLHG